MESITEFCRRMGIVVPVYYKIAHKLGHRPSEEEIKEHKRTAKRGRPRKERF